MKTQIPEALPQDVAWIPVPRTRPAPPAKPAPPALGMGWMIGAIALGLGVGLAIQAGGDAWNQHQINRLTSENATLREQARAAQSAKAAYCQGVTR